MISHLLLYETSLIQQFNYAIYDFVTPKISFGNAVKKSSHTVLIDIDEKSLKAVGQWPWPRVVMADLVEKTAAYNPSVIGLDIIFPEKDRTSPKMISAFYHHYFNLKKDVVSVPKALADNDMIFANTLQQQMNAVAVNLTNKYQDDADCHITNSLKISNLTLQLKSYKYALCNTPVIQESAKFSGFINADIDQDGILRRMTLLKRYKDVIVPSFALALLSAVDPHIKVDTNRFMILDNSIKTDKDSSFLLHFYAPEWYKKISAVDLLNNNIDPAMIAAKIVVIGSSAIGLHDNLFRTNGVRTFGAKVHMTAIDNLLENTIINEPVVYKYINIIISTLLILLLLYLLIKNRNLLMVTVVLTAMSIYALLTYYLLDRGVYISSGYFYLPFIVNFMLISISFVIVDSYKKRLFIEELDRSHVALLDSMVYVAEVHDIETGAHILRTKKYIKLMGEHIFEQPQHPYHHHLSKAKIEMMYRTAPLHDIGKVGIPDSVLKKPGKLTFVEYEVMKTHPDLGRHIIKNAMNSYEENDFFTMAINIAYTHHEKWDGTGYPEGLKGKEIPLEGRFMAIADVYDALVNARVYKEAFSYEEAYEIIKRGRGTHFDPLLVDAFFELTEEFKDIANTYSDNFIREEQI